MKKIFRLIIAGIMIIFWLPISIGIMILPPFCLFIVMGIILFIGKSFEYLMFDQSDKQKKECKEDIQAACEMMLSSFILTWSPISYVLKGKSK